jgi:hypothetical protein
MMAIDIFGNAQKQAEAGDMPTSRAAWLLPHGLAAT